MAEVAALRDIISEGIAAIEGIYASHRESVPSLDQTHAPPSFNQNELLGPTNAVIAAAAQLIATLTPPHVTVFSAAGSVNAIFLNCRFSLIFSLVDLFHK